MSGECDKCSEHALECKCSQSIKCDKCGSKTESIVNTRLIPLTDWSKFHPWPTLGALRHLVFHAKTNGFDRVIKRASGRVLLDEEAFFRWVEQHNTHTNGGSDE